MLRLAVAVFELALFVVVVLVAVLPAGFLAVVFLVAGFLAAVVFEAVLRVVFAVLVAIYVLRNTIFRRMMVIRLVKFYFASLVVIFRDAICLSIRNWKISCRFENLHYLFD